MKILGIETSCDETAAAVVEDGVRILSNVVVSQIDIFAEYGGVIPEVAARSHLEVMMPVVSKALKDASCTWDDIDTIAVTYAPGLLGSLLIGTLTARTLAILHDKPLYAVHHLKSHVYANWLNKGKVEPVLSSAGLEKSGTSYTGRPGEPSPSETNLSASSGIYVPDFSNHFMLQKEQVPTFPTFPILALVISGGHTQILYMPAHNQFEIIGTTRDDAVGECFDKVAKILGLPYPGGPSIAKAAQGEFKTVAACPSDTLRAALAKSSRSAEHIAPVLNSPGDALKYRLPHPIIDGLDFSFSGLKTAVLRAVQKEVGVPISYPSHKLKELLTPQQVADFAASFQKTAVDILVEKLNLARKMHPDVKSVVIAGGVSANKALRKALPEAYFPAPCFSGDNGAMVAAAAYYEIQSGVKPTDPYKLNIYPRISIEK
ncbi:tRNA (adenosine(37)-N6)-threonylcarbamoyltransferase complex transferase subunit TsaD [Candidatus Saccharibacteria bacterium]|nr:tRNA (adenosine(37)-N6)-threonylcarbamoyltransferase complex transferase subunit TsaD [Candidatus Saccharibacteria bacterium]